MAKKKRAKKSAKKKSGLNKSEAIRDYIKKNPQARNVDVVAALAKTGIKVPPSQVSTVRAKMSGPKRKKKAKGTQRKAAGKAGRPAASDQVSVAALIQARRFAAEVGGVDEAISLLRTVEKLSD